MSPQPTASKAVHLIPKDSSIKKLCFDEATGTLRPNLALVDREGSVVFEINELGLKGAARDLSRKLAVVWGDSVVFGVRWGWPCLLDGLASHYQFLNGGIEGDPYENILRRAAAFNALNGVALNIVMVGWHPMSPPPQLHVHSRAAPGLRQRIRSILGLWRTVPPVSTRFESVFGLTNEELRGALLNFLHNVPNTVLVTMPTALSRKIVDEDLSPWFVQGDSKRVFYFAGDAAYSPELQRYLFHHICERNAIVRQVAQETAMPLVDLAATFDTERLADFREDFHDVLHLRPRAYPKVAAVVYSAIKDILV